MPFQKGQGGRPKGASNKVTKATREAFQLLVDKHWDNLDAALEEVRAEDAQAYIKLLIDLSGFCVPRLKAIEHSGEVSTPLVQINIPPGQAPDAD